MLRPSWLAVERGDIGVLFYISTPRGSSHFIDTSVLIISIQKCRSIVVVNY